MVLALALFAGWMPSAMAFARSGAFLSSARAARSPVSLATRVPSVRLMANPTRLTNPPDLLDDVDVFIFDCDGEKQISGWLLIVYCGGKAGVVDGGSSFERGGE